jgi:basic membrane protein A
MKDNTVALAPFGNKVPEETKKLIADKQKALVDGTFDVFTGPILDQAGATKVADGKKLTLDEVLGMNWFVKGVDGTIPK